MENNEISHHELRVFGAAKDGEWATAKEIAARASVADRTARHHCLRLVKLGVFDQAEVFPAHRYRLSDKAIKRNAAYMNRLAMAASVFPDVD